MTRIHETIHSLRQKPVHVRENIAIGVAGGVSLIVAVLWFVANSASGTFSLTPSTLGGDEATASVGAAVSSGKDGFTQLLGAAGAAVGATSTSPSIQIVDTQVHSTLDNTQPDASATVIHF